MTYDIASPEARLQFRLLHDAETDQFTIIGRGGYSVQLPADLNADLIEMRRLVLATEQAFEQMARACDAVDTPAHG
jgi:hypothetical protein